MACRCRFMWNIIKQFSAAYNGTAKMSPDHFKDRGELCIFVPFAFFSIPAKVVFFAYFFLGKMISFWKNGVYWTRFFWDQIFQELVNVTSRKIPSTDLFFLRLGIVALFPKRTIPKTVLFISAQSRHIWASRVVRRGLDIDMFATAVTSLEPRAVSANLSVHILRHGLVGGPMKGEPKRGNCGNSHLGGCPKEPATNILGP